MRHRASLGLLGVALALAAPVASAVADPTISEFAAGSKAMYIEPSAADQTLWITRQTIGVQQFALTGERLASDPTPAEADLAVDTDGSVYWAVKPPVTPTFAGWAKRAPNGTVTKTEGGNAEGAYAITLRSPGATPTFAGAFPTCTCSAVYDGNTFLTYGPGDSRITGLTKDGTGRLWALAPEAHTAVRTPLAPQSDGIGDLAVTLPADTMPGRAALGPDGNLWIAGFGNSSDPAKNTTNRIIRLTPQGVQTSFVLPAGKGPNDITLGPDGALWFTEYVGNSIGRITTAGAYTSFPVPTAAARPYGITTGPDRAIWFTEYAAGQVGRLVTGSQPIAGTSLTGVKDTTKPRVGSIGLSRSRFRAAGSGASVSAKKKKRKKKVPVGTKVSYSLSEAGSVRFTVARKASGRRSGRKCVAPKRSNRKKKRCTRYLAVKGSFSVRGKLGKNTFTFRGRVGGKKLRTGSYRLTGKATDPAKNVSAARQKAFTIVR